MRELRRITVPAGKMREWWHLAYREIWNQHLSAGVGPMMKPEKLIFKGIGRSRNGLDVRVAIKVVPESKTEARVEITECPRVEYENDDSPEYILPRPKRDTDSTLSCRGGWGVSKLEEDPNEIAQFLKDVADRLQKSAVTLAEHTNEYIVAIPIEVEINWPVGCFKLNQRTVFCTEYESFTSHLGLYTKIVSSTSAAEALAAHEEAISAEVALMGALCGRYATLATEDEGARLHTLALGQFPRAELAADSKLLRFLEVQKVVESYDPYSERGSMERVFRLPKDLPRLFAAYDISPAPCAAL